MRHDTPFFILSRHWSDTSTGVQLRYWLLAEGQPTCWIIEKQESTCFVAESYLERWQLIWRRSNIDVRVGKKQFTALMGDSVVPVYSQSFVQQRRWVRQGRDQGLRAWEDDINPADRYLMERFLFGSLLFENNSAKPTLSEPALRVLSIDIETAWFEPGKTPALYSVALAGDGLNEVYIVGDGHTPNDDSNQLFHQCVDLKACLNDVVASISRYNPDCIVGWNVIDFDLRILQNHCDQASVLFAIGRNAQVPVWRSRGDNADRFNIEIEGRLVVDGPGAFRSAAWAFEDYTLETVSRTLLNRGKKIDHSDDRVNEIERMYRHDLAALAKYNLEDARLVIDLFEIAGLWHFLIERSHLTGLPMDRPSASSAITISRRHRTNWARSTI